MNTPVLTAGQVEFAEIFERLERDFKMTRADVARALHIERSYVSMLIKGQRTPHIRLLESMRALEKGLVASHDPATPAFEDTKLNRMMEQLKTLEKTDPTKFELARNMVDALAQNSSKQDVAASKLLKKAAASVSKPRAK